MNFVPVIKNRATKPILGAGFYIKLNRKFKKTILSCGGQLKNTFAVGKGNFLFVSPTFGDLEHLENYQIFESFIKNYLKRHAIKPEIVAFDLHPDYLSTKFAKSLNISDKIGIQHHYAHMASFFTQEKPNGKVIGITFDGTGFGLDGNVWGGEFLIGDLTGFERKGHLKYVPMPGGERAIKEPWRMAVSWLYQIYGEDFLNLRIKFVEQLDRSKWAILKKMIDRKINSPLTSSIGRLFDAVSSLIGIRDKVEYEAQAAIELEGIAEKDVRDFYEINIEPQNGIYVIDPSPLFISIVEDLRKNIATSVISARFHNSISRLINEVCMKLRDSLAIEVVVLSGGVFLNRCLVNKVKPQLVANGFRLLENDKIPVGDSGISIGQALIADGRS